MSRVRISYVFVGDGGTGWRDVDADRSVTVQRGDTLYSAKASGLKPNDIARGVHHSRIFTGPPVRILRVRPI